MHRFLRLAGFLGQAAGYWCKSRRRTSLGVFIINPDMVMCPERSDRGINGDQYQPPLSRVVLESHGQKMPAMDPTGRGGVISSAVRDPKEQRHPSDSVVRAAVTCFKSGQAVIFSGTSMKNTGASFDWSKALTRSQTHQAVSCTYSGSAAKTSYSARITHVFRDPPLQFDDKIRSLNALPLDSVNLTYSWARSLYGTKSEKRALKILKQLFGGEPASPIPYSSLVHGGFQFTVMLLKGSCVTPCSMEREKLKEAQTPSEELRQNASQSIRVPVRELFFLKIHLRRGVRRFVRYSSAISCFHNVFSMHHYSEVTSIILFTTRVIGTRRSLMSKFLWRHHPMGKLLGRPRSLYGLLILIFFHDLITLIRELPSSIPLIPLLLDISDGSSVYEEDIKLLKCEIYLKEVAITELRIKLELAQRQKDEIRLTVEKFENSSKNLNKLLDCQIVDKCKIGLGYNVVPPPYTRNFMPPKHDLSLSVIEEFVNDHIDWVSDSEEEDVPQAKKEKEIVKSSFAKIEFVKSKEQVKTPRKTTVKQGNQNRQNTYSPRGNQRNWNNMMSQRLGSNFEMTNKACYVCGSFDHMQYNCDNHQRQFNNKKIVKPVWNYSQRVNHQIFSRMTHPSPKRNMVPKAVLMRSGLVSLTTARSVNTAQPKTTMIVQDK
ncbi:hypothetical protein Tco_0162960 [Tanacetum coccineum]